MYVPANFRPSSPAEMESVIKEHPFGLLLTDVDHATHIPMELKVRDNVRYLEGHLSAANPHVKVLNHSLSLAVFTGPHCYISSSWYEKVNVPTWNYISVHVKGNVKILDEQESFELIREQMNRYETVNEQGTKLSDLPQSFLDAHLRGIVCFRMEILKMDAAFKLSQNRNDQDHAAIISQLESLGDTASVEIALWMRKNRP